MFGEKKTRRRRSFDFSKFVARSLFLPKRDAVISNLLTYTEDEIRYCGLIIGLVGSGFGGRVKKFITLDSPITEDRDTGYEEGDGC